MSIATEIQRLQTAKADIKSAIEQKGVTVGDGLIDTYAEKISEISSGGGSQTVDLFPYTANVTFHADIQEITENITLHLERTANIGNLFDMKIINAPKVTVYINDSCNTMLRAFGRAGGAVKAIEIIGNTSKVTQYGSMFSLKNNLKRVLGNFDFSSTTDANSMFDRCTALEEFYPIANTIKISISFASCPNLIPESRQSIFDGLATVETAQTLTLHKNLKILQSQVDSANAKGWTIAGGTVVSEEEYYG